MTTTQRDELAVVIDDLMSVNSYKSEAIADDLIRLGYRKPRVIETAAELDALPVGSVVLSGFAVSKRVDEFWWKAGWSEDFASTEIALPATVLHEGAA